MNFQEIIQEIDAEITTNGANEITGAKLNSVLKHIVNAVVAELPQYGKVTIFIPGSSGFATFLWPYESTPLSDLTFEGYNGTIITGTNAYPVEGMQLSLMEDSSFSEYSEGGWFGDLESLETGKWYTLENGVAESGNSMVMIGIRTT